MNFRTLVLACLSLAIVVGCSGGAPDPNDPAMQPKDPNKPSEFGRPSVAGAGGGGGAAASSAEAK